MGRLTGLDALRGIAAFCVLLYHFRLPYPDFGVPRGYLAVDFFFMLSGYVMARTYEHRMQFGKFMVARIKRIFPVVFLGGLLGIPTLIIGATENWQVIALANLLFIPALWLTTGPAFPLNIVLWSIFFELLANVLHGLVFHRIPSWALLAVAGISAIFCAFYGFRGAAFIEAFWVGLPRVLLSYCLGIVLWRWWQDKPPFGIPPIAALLALPVVSIAPWNIDLIFVLLGCPLIIAGGLQLKVGKWATWAGGLSFPLYAAHKPILEAMAILRYPFLSTVVVITIATVCVAIMTGNLSVSRYARHSPEAS